MIIKTINGVNGLFSEVSYKSNEKIHKFEGNIYDKPSYNYWRARYKYMRQATNLVYL